MSEEQSEVKQVLPNRSESIGNLVKALAAAQKEYKPLKKSSMNPFYTTDKKEERFHTHRCVDCGERFSCCGELCADSEWALCRGCAGEREAVEMWQEAT